MIRTCMCHNYDYISNTSTELGKVNKASLCTTKHAVSVLVFGFVAGVYYEVRCRLEGFTL